MLNLYSFMPYAFHFAIIYFEISIFPVFPRQSFLNDSMLKIAGAVSSGLGSSLTYFKQWPAGIYSRL